MNFFQDEDSAHLEYTPATRARQRPFLNVIMVIIMAKIQEISNEANKATGFPLGHSADRVHAASKYAKGIRSITVLIMLIHMGMRV